MYRYACEVCSPEEASELLNMAQQICESAANSVQKTESVFRVSRGLISVAYTTHNKEKYCAHAKSLYDAETRRYRMYPSETQRQRRAEATYYMGIAHIFLAQYGIAIGLLEVSASEWTTLQGHRTDWLYGPLYHMAHAFLHLDKIPQAESILRNAITDTTPCESGCYSMRYILNQLLAWL